jgi:hypothetical protein
MPYSVICTDVLGAADQAREGRKFGELGSFSVTSVKASRAA